MNTRNLLRSLALLAGCAILMPTVALAHHCKGPHANDPGCGGGGGGGGGGGEPSLDVTFRCGDADTLRSCGPQAPNDPDRIQGDGGNAFMDGTHQVEAILTSFGRFRLNTGGNKKNGSQRNVYFDFTNGVDGQVHVPLEAVNVTTTDILPGASIPYRTVIHLNRRDNTPINDLRDITVGNTINLDMWADVVLSDGGATSSIFVRFDAAGANNECGSIQTASQDVQVYRESDTKWVVTAGPGTVGCVVVSDSNAGEITYPGDYVFGPFEYAIEIQP